MILQPKRCMAKKRKEMKKKKNREKNELKECSQSKIATQHRYSLPKANQQKWGHVLSNNCERERERESTENYTCGH